MKTLTIIGCGISGLTSALYAAKNGIQVTVISSDLPERSQSVMAAGGMNAADLSCGDSVELHVQDTMKSSHGVADEKAIEGLCKGANDILDELCNMGVLFHREDDGRKSRRAFGGQSKDRTAYAGTSTGKQIVTGLTRALRKYEKEGLVTFIPHRHFVKLLVKDNKACGVMVLCQDEARMECCYSDYVIMATGGMNALYGKTTGSVLCNASASAFLFKQGVTFSNLEFVQFHPTTVNAAGKHLLISEAARGEGGRLFYKDENGKPVYFMEEKYGPKGNLVTRDIVSQEMFFIPSQVYLDLTALAPEVIDKKLAEVKDLCSLYLDLDVKKEPIPVEPSVHFFMGGIAVDINHRASVDHLYAVGECACAYHGANRLGGNSLLAAVYSGKTAVSDIVSRDDSSEYIRKEEFEALAKQEEENYRSCNRSMPVYAKAVERIADCMNTKVGIVRCEEKLKEALDDISRTEEYIEKISTPEISNAPVCLLGYMVPDYLRLAKAEVMCAEYRKESRGAAYRSDYPETKDEFSHPTYVRYTGSEIIVGEKI